MSVLNIVDLEKMLDRFESYNLGIDLRNQVHNPNILSVRNMPPDLKKDVIDIIQQIDFTKYKNYFHPKTGHKEIITNFINLPPDPGFEYSDRVQYRNDLLKFLSISDSYRKTLVSEYLPSLYNLLHLDNHNEE